MPAIDFTHGTSNIIAQPKNHDTVQAHSARSDLSSTTLPVTIATPRCLSSFLLLVYVNGIVTVDS